MCKLRVGHSDVWRKHILFLLTGWKSRRRDWGGLLQLETCCWGSHWTVQALVHAFQSIFTCSGDERALALAPSGACKVWNRCPGVPRRQSWKKPGGLRLHNRRLGWGVVPPWSRVLDCTVYTDAKHKVPLLILPSVTPSGFLCVFFFKDCCHAVERERRVVVPACTKSVWACSQENIAWLRLLSCWAAPSEVSWFLGSCAWEQYHFEYDQDR